MGKLLLAVAAAAAAALVWKEYPSLQRYLKIERM